MKILSVITLALCTESIFSHTNNHNKDFCAYFAQGQGEIALKYDQKSIGSRNSSQYRKEVLDLYETCIANKISDRPEIKKAYAKTACSAGANTIVNELKAKNKLKKNKGEASRSIDQACSQVLSKGKLNYLR